MSSPSIASAQRPGGDLGVLEHCRNAWGSFQVGLHFDSCCLDSELRSQFMKC